MNDRERKEKELELLRLREREAMEAVPPIEAAPVPQEDNVGTLEALGQGAAQGATLGWGEEASAGLELGMGRVSDLIRRLRGKEPVYKDVGYGDLLRSYREDIARVKEARPKTFMAGELLGGAVTTAPLGAGSGAALKLGQAVKTGAALGAVGAAGTSEKESLGKTIGDVAIGAAGGAAFGALGHGVSKLFNAGKTMEIVSDEFAARTTGMPSSQIRRIGMNKFRRVGKLLQNENIVNRPTTLKAMERDVLQLSRHTGQQLDGLYTQAEKAIQEGPFTPTQLVKYVQGKLQGKEEFVDPEVIESVGKELTKLLSKTDLEEKMGVKSLWRLSQKLDDVVNRYGRSKTPADESIAKGLFDATDEIRGVTRDWISATLPELGDEIGAQAAKYSSLINAKQAVQGLRARTAGRLLLSPYAWADSPALRSTIQAGLVNPAKLIAKLPGKYGPLLEKALQKGTRAFAATHYSLMQQDPEYREAAFKLEPEAEEE